MLRSVVLRHATRFALLIPFVLPVISACGDDTSDTSDAGDGGPGSDAKLGSDAADGANPSDGAPTVLFTYPATATTGASTAGAITATFSKPMAAATLTALGTFTLMQGSTVVPGGVTYYDNTAAFAPATDLAVNTSYTATITTAATDIAGHALGATYTWSFTTDATPRVGPKPVLLGAAGGFVVLAKSAVSTVPPSAITGNVGLSPAAASYITGFSLTRAGTMWTSPQVVGSIFASDNDPPTPTNLTTAILNMETAYTDAAGRPTPDFTNLGAGTIGGLTLAPGLYTWASSVTIPLDVTISGRANDTWIFQISGDLTMASEKSMTLIGGARAKNIVWQVAGRVDFGTTSHAEGVVLSKTKITLGTGASINGRLQAQTQVTLDSNAIGNP